MSSIVFCSGSDWSQVPHLTRAGWTGIAFLGILCYALGYLTWYDALQVLPAAQAGAFLYLEPLVTMLVAALKLNENITLASFLGGGIILLCVWLVNRPEMARANA
jgi:drug/metabolite transporter (DMT)-like permease